MQWALCRVAPARWASAPGAKPLAWLQPASQNYLAHKKSRQKSLLHKITLSTTNKKDCIEKAAKHRRLWEFSRVKGTSEHLYLCLPSPPLSEWGLWPACKIAAVHSWTNCLRPFWPQTKGASKINRALLHAPGLRTWSYWGWPVSWTP